jgi:hypothetical protein
VGHSFVFVDLNGFAELEVFLGACPQPPIGERAALPKPLPQGVNGEQDRALRIAGVEDVEIVSL